MSYIENFEEFNESDSKLKFLPINLGGNKLVCEICRSHKDGLIGRNIERDGMVFLFEDAQALSFHTKGCIIPIDIVFVLDKKVVKIEENCKPNSIKKFECGKGDTVLEFPAGTCKNLGIKPGIFCNI